MELFKLFGTIAIHNSDANKALDETADIGNRTQSKLSNAFGKIGSAAVKVGKAAATGIAVGTVAITALSKSALDSYADYEQLVGGVETLFGTGGKSLEEYAASVGKSVNEVESEYNSMMKAQEEVLANADKAYKTAGMSANEYMETVTSFSASLIQSLGGDTEKAAQKADQAILDMSDNANKMGTSIESIQDAYQGFAKQNYTMLDNLKLGFGGTKEEMQRLLDKAEEISGYEYDISSFADIVDAIHVVQEEMGIAGTTAKEAGETISGSVNSMKAAWRNLVTALGRDNADLDTLMNQFVDSVSTAAGNIIPRIEIILQGIGRLFEKLVPQLVALLVKLTETLLPVIVNGAITLVDGLVQAMPQIINALMNVLPMLIEGIIQIMQRIVQALPDMIAVIIQALPALIPILVTGITDMIVMLCTMLPQIIQPIIDNLPMIIEAIVTALIANAPKLVEAGIQLMLGLFQGMLSLVTKIPEILQAIFDGIVNGFKALFGIHSPSTVMAELGTFLMQGLFDGIRGMMDGITQIWNTLKEKTAEKFNEIRSGVVNVVSEMKDKVTAAVGKLAENTVSKFNELKDKASEKVNSLKEAAVNKFTELKDKAVEKVNSLKESSVAKFTELKNKAGAKIEDLKEKCVAGFEALKTKGLEKFENLKSGVSEKMDKVTNFVSNGVQKLKDFFNFDWKLPHIKLPHFSIEGSFSLNPPSIPHIGVEWYKKAMDAPVIMDKPTAFGINASGQIMAGGEAGSEVVSGTKILMDMISSAVAENNRQLYEMLNQIYLLLSRYLPGCADMQMVLDTGTLVGEIARPMDEELGKIAHMRERTN